LRKSQDFVVNSEGCFFFVLDAVFAIK
jgi:hypothetical protein